MSPLWPNSLTNAAIPSLVATLSGTGGGRNQAASLEKLGDKRATGSKSHLEAQGLIAVINVFSLATADSLFIPCCRCPVTPVMDWIQSSLQHGVTNLLKGTTNPMIYASVRLGWGHFHTSRRLAGGKKRKETAEKWRKQI